MAGARLPAAGHRAAQNGKALNLQAEELKHAVDQYKEMARVANEQLMWDKDATARSIAANAETRRRQKAAIQPLFTFAAAGGSHSNVSNHIFSLVNAGGPSTNVTLTFDDGTPLGLATVHYWGAEQGRDIHFDTARSGTVPPKVLTAEYSDAEGDKGSVSYDVLFIDGGNNMPVARFYPRTEAVATQASA